MRPYSVKLFAVNSLYNPTVKL